MRPNRKLAVLAAVVLTVAAALAVATATGAWSGGGAGAPALAGSAVDRPAPLTPLLDEHGRRVSLAAFRDKVVVLSPTLTLCHEVCPLVTGAFVRMQRAVGAAGLADRVVFAEVSVDPWRDSPARLRAYRRLTGVRFTLLTGTETSLRRFWRSLGVAFFRTPQGTPPDVDWWTHRPETFDVAHSDGLFLVDERGRLRRVLLGMPSVDGRLAGRLRALLNDAGRANLVRPEAPWTVPQALAALGSLLGREIREPGA